MKMNGRVEEKNGVSYAVLLHDGDNCRLENKNGFVEVSIQT